MPDSWAKAFLPTIALLYWTGNAGDLRDELRGAEQHRRIDVGVVGQHVAARLDRHDDLFQRRVAGALAEAVDGALDLARAALDAEQRVGDGEAEVVVAVGGEDRLVGVGHALAQHADERDVFLRHRVADGVGDVDGGGAGLDRRLDAAAEEVVLGARAVLRRPLDVVGVVARPRHRRDDRGVDRLRLHVELELHVQRTGRDEGVDALPLGVDERFGRPVDVLVAGAGEAADDGCLMTLPISSTDSKSPLEAIGKPASMTSTPISSRSSATCIFSGSVMEAPGDCSPSRKVVSKMMTRSFSEGVGLG